MLYPLITFSFLFIIYILKHIIYRQRIEGFYTLFTPYYYPETIQKYNRLNSKISNTKKYTVSFYTSEPNLPNFKLFLKSLISYKYPIINVNMLTESNNRNIIEYINTNDRNIIGIVPSPTLTREFINKEYKNLQFITSLNEQYIYILAPTNKGINTIYDLQNKIIGVGYKNSLWEQCTNDILESIDVNYQPYYNSLRLTLQNLYNGNIDAMVFTDVYPSELLNFIIYNFYNLHLIQLDTVKHIGSFYTKTKIDLNKITSLYMYSPNRRIKDNNYMRASLYDSYEGTGNNYEHNYNNLPNKHSPFSPYLTTYKFSNYLITNKNIDEELSYIITKHIFDNKLLIKKSQNAYLILPIPFSDGSKKYYMEKGYMSNNDSANCVYFYGKQRCNDQNLKEL